MQISDDKDKRENLAQNLKKGWQLLNEVHHYLDPSFTDQSDIDFLDLTKAIVPDKEDVIKTLSLPQLVEQVKSCTLCPLYKTRTNSVSGQGGINARLMVIGEAPGKNEDLEGLPFVGNSGKYLDSWMKAINLTRDHSLYITNIVKCRPPNNRDPEKNEIEACLPYLKQQIALIKPEAILCLGKVAANTLFENQEPLKDMRQKVFRYQQISTVVTYHPSAVLRNLSLRKEVWDDLKLVASLLNLPIRS